MTVNTVVVTFERVLYTHCCSATKQYLSMPVLPHYMEECPTKTLLTIRCSSLTLESALEPCKRRRTPEMAITEETP